MGNVFRVVMVTLFCCAVTSLYADEVDRQGPFENCSKNRLYSPEIHDRADYWGDPDTFLDAQARRLLDEVDQTLIEHAPRLIEHRERRLALLLLDAVLHDPDALSRLSLHDYLDLRMCRAVVELENIKVDNGAVIWKLYNEGFVIRTPSVTIGFDIVQSVEGIVVSESIIDRIIQQCDVLFISHKHRDHADPWVAKRFINQQKPVVAPPQVWSDEPIHDEITHLKRESYIRQTLPLGHGKPSLNVVVYPGHQGSKVENNVSVVFTPEGLSFCQTGDQKLEEDFSWIDRVYEHHMVDVLMPNCWTLNLPRMVDGFRPKLVLPGHENEMNHSVEHREPNWLTYERTRDLDAPVIVMTWGESYHYQPVQPKSSGSSRHGVED